MAEDKQLRKLRRQAEKALAKQHLAEAAELLGELAKADPRSPRWPHKRGDLLRKLGDKKRAVDSYATAVDLYADQGFIARAVAMAKTVLNLDPSRIDILERVDPEAARLLHRRQRPHSASLVPGPMQHPMVIPDDAPTPRAHPMVIPDDAPAPRAHPMVIPDDAPAPRAHPMVIPDDDHLVVPGAPPLPDLDAPAPPPQARRRPSAALDEDIPLPPAQGKRRRRVQRRHPSLDDLSIPPPSPMQLRNLPPTAEDVPDLQIPAAPALPDTRAEAPLLSRAPALEIAPDVRPGETRFSNAPPKRAVSIDLSEIEFQPRRSIPIDDSDSLKPAPPTARKLSHLPLFPLFAELPKAALQQLMREADLVELGDGSLLVRRGDEADALYGIVEGSVQVIVPGHHLKQTLAEGDVFGEACLLPGERRHADVVVAGRLTALRVPKETLNGLIRLHPMLAEVLLEMLTRRLLGNLLQSSPLFQEFDAKGRKDIAGQFEVRRAPAGMLLAESGKRMDGLYITLTGKLAVSGADGVPVECGAGSMLGQRCLVAGEPSDVTVKTMVNMLVLRLPAERFTTVVMQYPTILAHVTELASTTVARVST